MCAPPRTFSRPRRLIRARGKRHSVIAKLEKPEAIDNLDEILAVADGVMVARGDLGVEMSPEKVPVVQKTDHLAGPRRAGSRDHRDANARIHEAESAAHARGSFRRGQRHFRRQRRADAFRRNRGGHYPLEAVQMMDRIIREAEASVTDLPRPSPGANFTSPKRSRTDLPRFRRTAHESDRRVHRDGVFGAPGFQIPPAPPIIAFSPIQETRRRMNLYWSVLPRTIARIHDIDLMVKVAEQRLVEEKLVKKGDIVGIVAGTPLGAEGSTNLMRLTRIGG